MAQIKLPTALEGGPVELPAPCQASQSTPNKHTTGEVPHQERSRLEGHRTETQNPSCDISSRTRPHTTSYLGRMWLLAGTGRIRAQDGDLPA